MTTGPTKGFCAASAWPLHTKKNYQRERKSQPSSRHLALSANPTVHRMDQDGLYHHWSAIEPMRYYGSKPKVKGRTLGTAVKSVGRFKAHLPTYIIENPPTVNAHILLPLSLFSVSFSLLLQWRQQQERQNNIEYDISALTLPLHEIPPPWTASFFLHRRTDLLFSYLLFYPSASTKCLNLHPKNTTLSITSCLTMPEQSCLQTFLTLPLWKLYDFNNEECT